MQEEEIFELLTRQLRSFWKISFSKTELKRFIRECLDKVKVSLSASNNKYFEVYGFSQYNTVHYSLLLYHLSYAIGHKSVEDEYINLADQIYYLNKIMNNVDWYWEIALPKYFVAEHPVGTVLGRAIYSDYFCVYQGVTVGGTRKQGELFYPTIGKYVTMYANASVLGDSHVGDNVIIFANAFVMNEDVPSNSIVSSSSDLKIKSLNEEKKERLIGIFWEWRSYFKEIKKNCSECKSAV